MTCIEKACERRASCWIAEIGVCREHLPNLLYALGVREGDDCALCGSKVHNTESCPAATSTERDAFNEAHEMFEYD